MNKYLKTLLILLTMVQILKAQDKKRILQPNDKALILNSVKTHLEKSYIDLELSKKMNTELDKNFRSNKYEKLTDPSEFAKLLTKDLQSVSNDPHLKVRFEPEYISKEKRNSTDILKLESERKIAMQMAEINYGFIESKILDGNIGYLNLRLFADIKYAEETATAAMNFLSNTNSIIIDLRTNGGGVPSMMQLLSSYFFDETPVLLSEFYERENQAKTQLYSLPNVKGKKFKNKPIYILTSKQTFSAAEALAYTLQHWGKAVVVGEATQGGANRAKRIHLNEEFTISVPYIKPIHPVTKTNWEGKGIQPNIETTEKNAFVYAYLNALNTTFKGKKDVLLNKIGYAFLNEKSVENAIIIFEENTKLFPTSANSWDSLGEAYFTKKDKTNALKSYKKALELDPYSGSIKAMIKKVESIPSE
ncbi:tetratricopeptide (TPR) repeat protein [Chryseobacterium jejuense]|nr:tetratricopeptide (TPR) repeat protein [Chryseobacterium jejuense]